MTSEHNIKALIRLALGCRPDVRLFNNPVGMAWQGDVIRRTADTITLRDPRPVHYGLTEGASDLLGFTTVVVAGHGPLAVFTAIEVKARDRATRPQLNFIAAVRGAGGFAGVARSVEEAVKVIENGR